MWARARSTARCDVARRRRNDEGRPPRLAGRALSSFSPAQFWTSVGSRQELGELGRHSRLHARGALSTQEQPGRSGVLRCDTTGGCLRQRACRHPTAAAAAAAAAAACRAASSKLGPGGATMAGFAAGGSDARKIKVRPQSQLLAGSWARWLLAAAVDRRGAALTGRWPPHPAPLHAGRRAGAGPWLDSSWCPWPSPAPGWRSAASWTTTEACTARRRVLPLGAGCCQLGGVDCCGLPPGSEAEAAGAGLGALQPAQASVWRLHSCACPPLPHILSTLQVLLQLNIAYYLPSIPLLALSALLDKPLEARLGERPARWVWLQGSGQLWSVARPEGGTAGSAECSWLPCVPPSAPPCTPLAPRCTPQAWPAPSWCACCWDCWATAPSPPGCPSRRLACGACWAR